jgi:hypothetical protein
MSHHHIWLKDNDNFPADFCDAFFAGNAQAV